MFNVRKKSGKLVKAYQLGKDDAIFQKLTDNGEMAADSILKTEDGAYEIISQEASLGGSRGQAAAAGDFVKIDSTGHPYPNRKAWFEAHHRFVSENTYEQIPDVLAAWDVNEPMCPEITFLVERKGLTIDEAAPDRYFTAPLWGTLESAAKNAVIVFYSITRDEAGTITESDFNFVERSEFEKTYDIVD